MKKTASSNFNLVNILGLIWLVFILFFLIIPYAELVVVSLSKRDINGGFFEQVQISAWHQLFDKNTLLIFTRSLILALINTLVCFFIGLPIAVLIWELQGRAKKFAQSLILIPLGVSVLLISFSWQLILGNNGFINQLLTKYNIINEPLQLLYTPFAIHIGLFGAYLSYFILTFNLSIEKIDRQFFINSSALGANFLQNLWHVLLPLSRPGLVTGIMLVFLPSFAEYVIPSLLGGNKVYYVGVYAKYQFFEGKNWPLGAAILISSTILLIFFTMFFFGQIKSAFFEER